MSINDQITVANKKHNRNSFIANIVPKTYDVRNTTSTTTNTNISIFGNSLLNSGPNLHGTSHVTNYYSHLHSVHGITYPGVGTLAISTEGLVAYPAGCVIVIYNMNKDTSTYIRNASRKAISSLSFSPDGRYIVVGEQGHKPCVRVFECSSHRELVSMAGHTHGVDHVSFHCDQNYVISVGAIHDKSVFVWNWRLKIKVAANNKTFKVNAISVTDDCSHIVLVGLRTVRFYMFNAELTQTSKRVNSLNYRNAFLGSYNTLNFEAVCCSKRNDHTMNKTYVIASTGIVLVFNSQRELEYTFQSQLHSAKCLAVTEYFIFCGGASGAIHIHDVTSFKYISKIPLTKFSITNEISSSQPTAISFVIDSVNHKLMSVYSDHSIYIWDTSEIIKNYCRNTSNININSESTMNIRELRRFLYHSSHIWSIVMYPRGLKEPFLPPSFLTGASDGTIRIWKLPDTPQQCTSTCPELYDIISPQDLSDDSNKSEDSPCEIKCLSVSLDGVYLSAGDRSGNVKIYNLRDLQLISRLRHHSNEVLQVDFSYFHKDYPILMASCSKDRTIQVYNVENGFSHLQSITSYHSSAVNCVKLFIKSSTQSQNKTDILYLISCGADRSIKISIFNLETKQFEMKHHMVNNSSINSIDADLIRGKLIVAGQEKNLRLYSLNEFCTNSIGKITGSGEEKGFLDVCFDSTGRYILTCSIQKLISLYDTVSGHCVFCVCGNAEMLTGAKFSSDGRYYVTVSVDGCVFIWSLPNSIKDSIQNYQASNCNDPDSNQIKKLDKSPRKPNSPSLLVPKLFSKSLSPNSKETKLLTTPLQSSPNTISKSFTCLMPTEPIQFPSTIRKQFPPWAQRMLNSEENIYVSSTQDAKINDSPLSNLTESLSICNLTVDTMLPNQPLGKWARTAKSMTNLSTLIGEEKIGGVENDSSSSTVTLSTIDVTDGATPLLAINSHVSKQKSNVNSLINNFIRPATFTTSLIHLDNISGMSPNSSSSHSSKLITQTPLMTSYSTSNLTNLHTPTDSNLTFKIPRSVKSRKKLPNLPQYDDYSPSILRSLSSPGCNSEHLDYRYSVIQPPNINIHSSNHEFSETHSSTSNQIAATTTSTSTSTTTTTTTTTTNNNIINNNNNNNTISNLSECENEIVDFASRTNTINSILTDYLSYIETCPDANYESLVHISEKFHYVLIEKGVITDYKVKYFQILDQFKTILETHHKMNELDSDFS